MRLALLLAVFGPALGAAGALVPGRPVRRALWFAGTVAALAAAAVLVVKAYGGSPVVYRSFRAGLFPSTLLVSLHLGVLLAGLRMMTLGREQERLGLTGLGIAAAGTAACALTTSAAVLALFVPVPTLGLAAATLAGRARAVRAPGLAGLALADVAAVLALVFLVRRADSNLLGAAAPQVTGWLLLAAAAVKAGAVPWVGAWTAGDDVPAARLAQIAVRAQGLVLIGLVGLVLHPPLEDAAVGAAVAVLALGCGLSALRPGRELAGLAALGPVVAGLGVALGGAVGARALILLLPILPVLWGGAWMLSVRTPPEPGPVPAPSAEPQPTRWAVPSSLAAAGVLASLAMLPLTGAFPGAWLALSLAATRAGDDPSWMVPVAAIVVAASLGAAAAARAVRAATPSRLAVAGLLVALGSLYAGIASGPLGLGWAERAEADLRVPSVLPSAGAPHIPPAPALRFALAALPALVLALLLLAVARGLRPSPAEAATAAAPAPEKPPAGARPALGVSPRDQVRFVVRNAAAGARAVPRLAGRMRARGAGWAVAAVAEGLAGVLIVRVLLDAAGRGFL